ncbi:hypothetical protein [Polyangium fumosum]|uniref:Alpha/beta hydrolase n=1 Tax=Polyangium fumosum TaxID=889272 RepID=A0A4U1IJ78_9BACT|nr:hypothetical protein [Polyangium fumosum]TKC93705.1 hypothetical protein E8A74_49015 [Polyangium fumosum]
MALRLVQAGEGNPRALVIAFLIGAELDPRLRAAFGPRTCVMADGAASGPMMEEILEFAHRRAGLRHVSRLALIGYSAGCQRVRALRLAGVEASAYLLADGTHASWPPADWQIDWLRQLVERARAGKALVVASHTMQTYTERLPKGKAFASTVRVLRMATGWELDRAGPLDAPAVTREGSLYVYSYASAGIDAAAHAAQLVRVVPELSARHLRPWLGPDQGPTAGRPPARRLPLGLIGFFAKMLFDESPRT